MGVAVLGEEVRMMELGAGFTPTVSPARIARGSEGAVRVCTDLVS